MDSQIIADSGFQELGESCGGSCVPTFRSCVQINKCKDEWIMEVLSTGIPYRWLITPSALWDRCCRSLLRGPPEGDLGGVGGAGAGLVLCSGDGCCVSHGAHQQHLGVLRWLCHIQVLLHAPHYYHNVSSLWNITVSVSCFLKNQYLCIWRNQ